MSAVVHRTVTYKALNDETVTKELQFYLNEADMIELELQLQDEGGLAGYVQKAIASEDGRAVVQLFRTFVNASYGKLAPDGVQFVKNKELLDEFNQTGAYSAFFMQTLKEAEGAANFINELMPEGLEESLDKIQAAASSAPPIPDIKKTIPYNEAQEMDRHELMAKLEQGYTVSSR